MNRSQDPFTGDFVISDVLYRIIRWWWVLALAMIIGGVCGILISKLQNPVFESTSVITTSIDFAYAGRLDDYKEDHLITAVGDVVKSSEVMDEVHKELIRKGFEVSSDDLDRLLTLSRQGYRWELSSRHQEPNTAKMVNQVWLDAAMANLEEIRMGSILAVQFLARQQSFESCISQSIAVDPVSASCSPEEFNELLKNLEEDGGTGYNDLIQKLLLSQISFQVTQAPNLPLKPVQLGTNLSTLAGAIAGLIVTLLVMVNYPLNKS